jgi:hypothetical protein
MGRRTIPFTAWTDANRFRFSYRNLQGKIRLALNPAARSRACPAVALVKADRLSAVLSAVGPAKAEGQAQADLSGHSAEHEGGLVSP